MARLPGLPRIIADHRAFLMAVERLHRRIDVQNPRLGQKRLRAMVEMTPKPSRPSLFLDRREGAPHRSLADDSLDVEKLCILERVLEVCKRGLWIAKQPQSRRPPGQGSHSDVLGKSRRLYALGS